jgi:hypothetical protein
MSDKRSMPNGELGGNANKDEFLLGSFVNSGLVAFQDTSEADS